MIAPEGIRDGRFFAEALYTFAGEGVEDLPFKKADANWWRGKIISTSEDGLFPACLVKFTETPIAEKAMKTAERLAHLSDVLTPSYAKDTETQSNQPDANSIESLLLNLANNEMQVQQQKVHAHMPRKPTRMKLLYEDHAQSVSVRSSSAMSTYKEPKPSVPKTKLPRPPLPPTPQRAHKSDVSSQAGLWSSRSSLQSANNSFTSFTSSIESMHEQSVRTEVGQSRASSMLFGPRGMPGSRSSSRVQDYAQSSLASLYSVSDNSASQTRTDHEAAISEARQLLDGIPSPTEHGVSSHEADYLFDDIDDDKDVDSKLQSMISPASENSVRFASYPSTVSSSASVNTTSKRLPTIPSTAYNSMVSDTSSCGLNGIGSAGDLTELHRSWYSSTDSLNLAGGGALKSPGVVDDDDEVSGDMYAPRIAKTKSRIRPTTGSVRMSEAPNSPAALAHQPEVPQQNFAYQQYPDPQPMSTVNAPPVSVPYNYGTSQPVYSMTTGAYMEPVYANAAPVYAGYDNTGRPVSAYGQVYYNQPQPVQANYYDPMQSMRSSGFVPPMSVNDTYGRPRSYTAGAPVMDRQASPQLYTTPQNIPIQAPQSMPATQQRSASFDATSTMSGTSNTLTSVTGGDHSQSFRGSMRSNTPNGFGSMSSTPPATFARRENNMSPFPSNVGTVSAPAPTEETVPDNTAKEISVDELDELLKQPLPPNITPINYVKTTRPVFKYGGHISHPETIDWNKVDRQMTMLRVTSVKLTVDMLATMHVGRPFNRPIERVRAAFMWVASNIQYDTSAASSTVEFEQQEAPNAVLQRRRSRGPGFAYLFDAMMNSLGIESHTVRGYLRQPLDTCQGVVLPAANHVWNAVCLDGEYRIIDTACASRSHPLNAESRTDPWFFLAPPRESIFTHFPLLVSDQFVDPVVPLPVFWMLPYVRPAYFTCRVKLLNLPQTPRVSLKDDVVVPLVLCVRDATLGVFAEVELHDPNGSGRIVARQPLLAQCMDYRGKRMVKVLVSIRGGDAHGLIKIYCGTRVPLQPKRPDASPKAHKVLGFLQNRDRRAPTHDYSRIQNVDEDGSITTVATSRTYPLACALSVTHSGRSNANAFVQPNAQIRSEFYIKEPTCAQLHLGESVLFHLLPVGDERLFHMQLRSPSGQQVKFVYQPSDQGYVLRHTVKERGAWIVIFHSDSEGWMPIASYTCT
ncbi:hypothetical protein IW145_000427 [Coemansia sp. RSA 521]|nr:hypothetical protein GGH15_001344 [Coemansia sp. RSA 562]KAJ2208816.1 hypothetical protein IW145_000427 [Coemansia sp. RSA 521]KAJ2278959.1 hypothetical protein J3F81_000224 [Coemansia sp. RSA 371]KAJ2283740.1 hypothetical protein GGH14_000667 [Coemansia sp. RSA 370]